MEQTLYTHAEPLDGQRDEDGYCGMFARKRNPDMERRGTGWVGQMWMGLDEAPFIGLHWPCAG